MNSGIVIDAVILIIIVLVGINGLRRGFFLSLTSMGAKIVSVLVAVLFHVPFLKFLDSLFDLRQRVSPVVGAFVSESIIETTITSYILKVISFLLLMLILYLTATVIINFLMKPLLTMEPIAALDKVAGLILSCVCIIFFISLICGLTEPVWMFAPRFDTYARNSLSYPLLMQAYQPSIQLIHTFFDDVLINPFNALPSIDSYQI